MRYCVLGMVVVLGAALTAMADFADDFQEAKKLLDAKDYPAAHDAFVKLAAVAPNAHGKGTSLSYAAIALGRQKRYDPAIALAKTIEAKPLAAYTQMAIMDANRRHKDLVAAFAKQDIAAWPDRINYKGLFLRGAANEAGGERQAALGDFERCVDLAGSDVWVRLEALNKIAALHHALGDDAKAMDTYRKAFAIYDEEPNRKGRWTYPQALLDAARMLMGQGSPEEAKAVLAHFSLKPSAKERGVWDFLVLEMYGDISAAQGKRAEALARYRDAAAIDTHQVYLDRVKKKMAAVAAGEKVEPK